MNEPLLLAFVVAAALLAIGAAVTYMLLRTVRRDRRPPPRKPQRTPTPVQLVLGATRDQPSSQKAVDPRRIQDRFRSAKDAGHVEKAARMAGSLSVLGAAEEEHHAFLRANPIPVDSHRWGKLDHSTVFQHVVSPRQDLTIDAILSLLAPHAAARRAHPPDAFGLREEARVGGPGDGPELVLTLHRAAECLGVALPHLYLDESRPERLVFANTLIAGRWEPSLVLGSRAALLDSAAQRAFVCGRKLAYLMPCMVLLAVLHEAEELASLLGAAASVLDGRTNGEADRSAPFMAEALSEGHEAELLAQVVKRRGGWPELEELKEWQFAAAESACRVGLVLAGDLIEACAVLREDMANEPREYEALVGNLVAFYTGPLFADIREQILRPR